MHFERFGEATFNAQHIIWHIVMQKYEPLLRGVSEVLFIVVIVYKQW